MLLYKCFSYAFVPSSVIIIPLSSHFPFHHKSRHHFSTIVLPKAVFLFLLVWLWYAKENHNKIRKFWMPTPMHLPLLDGSNNSNIFRANIKKASVVKTLFPEVFGIIPERFRQPHTFPYPFKVFLI